MKRSVLEKKLRQKLAAEGVKLEPGSRAERGVKAFARVSADLATAGEQAVRDTRGVLTRAAEAAREAMHEATKPRPKSKR
jgi:hypothetical protein